MESFTRYMAKAKVAVRRVGRPSRKDLGLEPVDTTTVKIERSVANGLRKKYGSLAEAMRVLYRMENIQKAS